MTDDRVRSPNIQWRMYGGTRGGQNDTNTVLSEQVGFPVPMVIPPLIHLYPGRCTVGSLVGAVPRYTLSPHSIKEQKENDVLIRFRSSVQGLFCETGMEDWRDRHLVTVDWALWRQVVAGQRSDLWYRTGLILNSGAIILTMYHELPILIVATTVQIE